MLLISLILSAVLLAITSSTAREQTRESYGAASGVALVGLVFGFCGSVMLILNGALLLIVCIASVCIRPRFRTFFAASLIATVLAYLIVGVLPLVRMAHLRAKYPFESMANRLEYENSNTSSQPSRKAAVQLKDASAKRLDIHEEKLDNIPSYRAFNLEQIHDETVQSFVNNPGFGVGRMSGPQAIYVDLPRIESVPLPPPDPEDLSAAADLEKPIADVAGSKRPPNNSLFELHESGLFDFINPGRFGYIKDRNHVAGFQSHYLQSVPQLDANATQRWKIQRLQLVSLLKHKKPVAYVSQNLPRMDELRHAKTRPLDALELTALKALRQGEDLHVVHFRNHIRMLGSVRALKQCLDCHDVQRGQLLGAFTYKLVRGGG